MSSKAFSWRDALEYAAKAEGIELSNEDLRELQTATDDSPLAIWVEDNLDLNNTLTADETLIWEHLCKTRSKLSNHNNDEIPIVPVDEVELQKVITALEASTNTTKSHITTLRRQKTLLESNGSDIVLKGTPNQVFQDVYERKQQTEAQQLKFHNVELLSSLKSELKSTQEKIEKSIRALPSRTTERLRSDDRIFENLNETSANSSNNANITYANDGNVGDVLPNHQSQTQIQSLLSALRKAITLYSQLHASTIYLHTLISPTSIPSSLSRVHDSEIQHLQADLSSLHDSIEDISAMLVHSLHGQNITSTFQRLEKVQNDIMLQDRIYVQNSIEKMTTELENLAEKTELLNSYRTVVEEIEESLERISTEHQIQSQLSTSMPSLSQTQQSKAIKSTTNSTYPPPSQSQPPALSSLLQNLNLNLSSNTHPTTTITASTTIPISALTPTSSSTALPPPSLPSFHSFQSRITNSSKDLLPSISSLLPTATTITNPTMTTAMNTRAKPPASSSSSSSSSSVPFKKELTTLSNLESRINEAKTAVEKIAAAGD